MAFVKKGTVTVTSGGTAQNLDLGFHPSYLRMFNKTLISQAVAGDTNGVQIAEWYNDMADASAWIWTTSSDDGTIKLTDITTDGFTPYVTSDASLWTATNLTITDIPVATAGTTTLITATNSLSAGDYVSFHGIVGMTEMNTLVGKVLSASGANFTVDINSSNFAAYVSGGIANVISGANYGLNSTSVQGNAGEKGLTLGSSLMVTTSDVWEYVAYLDTDVTS